LNHSRERGKTKWCAEATSQGRIAEVIFELEVLEEELNDRNSLRGTPEIPRTVGSKKVASKLSIGQIHLRRAGFNVDF
jgi:hypothetical protein